jgi:hypothetical protein
VLVLTLGLDSTRAAPGQSAAPRCSLSHNGKRERIAAAKLIIEYNATDRDIGVHGAFDSDGWAKLCVFDPKGRLVLKVAPKSQLKDLTMGGIFFESREPPIPRFTFRDLKRMFPEGRYRVKGVTFQGRKLVGSAKFTHDVPRRPRVTAPRDGVTVDRANVVVRWRDVTRTIDGKPVDITGYQVIVTKEQPEARHSFARPLVYDVHVSANRNSLRVPAEFFRPGSEYELEVLALEQSGNQTISVSFFETR